MKILLINFWEKKSNVKVAFNFFELLWGALEIRSSLKKKKKKRKKIPNDFAARCCSLSHLEMLRIKGKIINSFPSSPVN